MESGLNVRWYGAKGDGTTDDTPAFQRALNAAASSRVKVVRVPYGMYKLTATLAVPISVVLEGTSQKPAYQTTYNPEIDNTTFVIKTAQDTTVPAVVLSYNSGIKNFTFFWPDQLASLTTPIPYGYAISTKKTASQSDKAFIENITLTNAYNGLDLDFSGQMSVRDIFGQVFHVGMRFDRMYDVTRLENIHFWPFYAGKGTPAQLYSNANARVIVVGKADGLQGNNLFAFGHKSLLHFTNFGSGAGWVQFTNILADECAQPINIEKVDILQLTSVNGSIVDKKNGRAFIETGTAVGGDVTLSNLNILRPQTAINISSTNGTFRISTLAIRKRGDLIFDVNQYKVINQSTAKVYIDEAEFDEVSGNVQVGGQGKWWTSLTDISSLITNFSTPNTWPMSSTAATGITGGTRFDLKGAGLKVVRVALPTTLYPNSAYVLECDLQINNPGNLNADGQFFLRLTDTGINDILLPGSNLNGYYVNKTHLKVPFVIRRDGLYFDFVFGNNSNAGAVSMDLTNLKLSRIEEPALNQSLIDWLHSRQPNALSDPAPNLAQRRHIITAESITVDPDAVGMVTVLSGSPVTITLNTAKARKRQPVLIQRYDANLSGAVTIAVTSGQVQNETRNFVGSSTSLPGGVKGINYTYDGANTHSTISY
jgi:hypothetical protein